MLNDSILTFNCLDRTHIDRIDLISVGNHVSMPDLLFVFRYLNQETRISDFFVTHGEGVEKMNGKPVMDAANPIWDDLLANSDASFEVKEYSALYFRTLDHLFRQIVLNGQEAIRDFSLNKNSVQYDYALQFNEVIHVVGKEYVPEELSDQIRLSMYVDVGAWYLKF